HSPESPSPPLLRHGDNRPGTAAPNAEPYRAFARCALPTVSLACDAAEARPAVATEAGRPHHVNPSTCNVTWDTQHRQRPPPQTQDRDPPADRLGSAGAGWVWGAPSASSEHCPCRRSTLTWRSVL